MSDGEARVAQAIPGDIEGENARDRHLRKRKGLFGLMVSQVSSIVLGPVVRQHFLVGSEGAEKRKRKELGPSVPLETMPPTSLPPTRPHLLSVPPLLHHPA
jgi:hypothetical protein